MKRIPLFGPAAGGSWSIRRPHMAAALRIPHPPFRVQTAFTLVELLVAIAIIALLGALLLPALSAAKTRARATACLSNLHQLGIALHLYLQEESAFPLATAGDGLGAWQRGFRPAVSQNVFHCPQSQPASDRFISLFRPANETIQPHYGYNFLGGARRNPPPFNLGLGGDFRLEDAIRRFIPTPESRVVAPSEMLALGDSSTFVYVSLGQPPPDPEEVLYLAFPHIVPQFNQPGVGDWHDGRANMLFCDGHTESAPQARWIEATPESRRRWNNDHLPHEETW